MSPNRDRFKGRFPEKRPRLAGPKPPRELGRRPFGATWWGKAWVEALERRARLDPNRLPRGRTYARGGAVGDLEVHAGEVLTTVQGSRRTPYKVRVGVRTFSDAHWDLVVGALAAQAGHAAALLEGELVPEVAEDVRSIGLDLLPGAGEVQPRCNCPDSANPCKHAAAVCYLVADELDRDPFVLFLLRGKSREELLHAVTLQRRSGYDSGAPSTSDVDSDGSGWPKDSGIGARDAWNREEGVAATSLPAPPRVAGRPVLLLDAAPVGSGLDVDALTALAADAARRALELSVWGGGTPGGGGSAGGGEPVGALDISVEEDCARWGASILDGESSPVGLDELARRCGIARADLTSRALAWNSGGRGGLSALSEEWDPEPSSLEWGREQLGPRCRVSRNRVTSGGRQLRLGRDGHWYAYRKVGNRWQPDVS